MVDAAPVVLITGANRGIGLALARKYGSIRYRVLATCPDPEDTKDLEALTEVCPFVEIHHLDIMDDQTLAALQAKLDGRRIDILINNAGIISGDASVTSSINLDPSQTFGTIDPDGWARVLQLNGLSPVIVSQALLPNLKASERPRIVMISSRMGSISDLLDPNFFAYSTSKTLLNAAMRNMALHLQKDGIIVTSLNPGWVRTRMGGEEEANLTPQESAARLVHVIDTLKMEQTGLFINHTGETIPW